MDRFRCLRAGAPGNACRPPRGSLPFVHVPLPSAAALNSSLAGKEYPRIRFSVSAERVRAFARAIGAEDSQVPPTFATAPEMEALAEILQDPELDLDFTRVVHTEESYEWVRPIRVGEELTARPVIESIRSKAGSEILVVATEINDQSDATVIRARCTLVARPPAGENGGA